MTEQNAAYFLFVICAFVPQVVIFGLLLGHWVRKFKVT